MLLPACPISSGVAGPKRTSAVQRRAVHRRLSSHLDMIFSAIISYFSMKCRAISEIEPCAMTTLVPVSAIDLMICDSVIAVTVCEQCVEERSEYKRLDTAAYAERMPHLRPNVITGLGAAAYSERINHLLLQLVWS
jgi:hypothetical protein